MILAIIGSRDLRDQALFERVMGEALEKWGRPTRIVSGGARGADRMGEVWARKNAVDATIYHPQWKKYGKSAGLRRNHDIIDLATHVLAFPSHRGKGTQHSIAID